MNQITPPPMPGLPLAAFSRGEFPLQDLPEPVTALPSQIFQALEQGRVRDLLALDSRDFEIRPIARRLSQINRYAGALRWPYPVSVHSLLVAKLVEIAHQDGGYTRDLFGGRPPVKTLLMGEPDFDSLAYEALMHDVTEAFGINDMIRPVKVLLPEYGELESRIRAQLVKPFGLRPTESAAVRRADERAYQLECKFMKGQGPGVARTTFEPWPVTAAAREAALFYCCQEFYWKDAARLFVDAFERLAPDAVKEVCL